MQKRNIVADFGTIAQYVVEQLVGLGYNRSLIKFDYLADDGKRIDIAVLDRNGPYVVIELITKPDLPLVVDDPAHVRFHPAVRQAQRLSRSVGAKYYVVASLGRMFWFQTDSGGRPQLLESPVVPQVDGEAMQQVELMPETRVLDCLNQLLGAAQYREKIDWPLAEVAFAIRAYLELRGNADQLISGKLEFQTLVEQSLLHKGNATDHSGILTDEQFYRHALSILERAQLENIELPTLISAFDIFLALQKIEDTYRVPAWLASLIVQLTDVQDGDELLDIDAHYADLLAEVTRQDRSVKVTCVAHDLVSYAWTQLKLTVLNSHHQHTTVLLDSTSLDKTLSYCKETPPNKIIVIPPFGVRLSQKNLSYTKSEQYYISRALDLLANGGRIVAVVPENLLSSKKNNDKLLREKILSTVLIRANLSLETLWPNSFVRGSVLVLEKRPSDEFNNRVLMGCVRHSDIPDSSPIALINIQIADQIPVIAQFLDLYRSGTTIPAQGKFWFVPHQELSAESLSATHYKELLRSSQPTLFDTTAQLSDLAYVFKGSPVTLDDKGDLPVIGPAAVRRFYVDAAKLDRTTTGRVPQRAVIAQTNDVVVHALGKYLGHAALVTTDFEGMLISRNIIVVRPDVGLILPSYLTLALNSEVVIGQLRGNTSGTVIEQITKGVFDNLRIPVPPLATQQLLVDSVYSAQQDVDNAMKVFKQAEAMLQEARKRLRVVTESHSWLTGGGAR